MTSSDGSFNDFLRWFLMTSSDSSNTREDYTPVAGFSGNASCNTHRGDLNARVHTNNNQYINLVDKDSTLVIPDCVRRLYSVRQATHKGYKVQLDST